jgi:hypothetical protein
MVLRARWMDGGGWSPLVVSLPKRNSGEHLACRCQPTRSGTCRCNGPASHHTGHSCRYGTGSVAYPHRSLGRR